MDPRAAPGWVAEWRVEDRYGLLPEGERVALSFRDFTEGAEAGSTEAWVVEGIYSSTKEAWIPRLMIRRRAKGGGPLASTFVGLIEPHGGESVIRDARRLSLSHPGPALDSGR